SVAAALLVACIVTLYLAQWTGPKSVPFVAIPVTIASAMLFYVNQLAQVRRGMRGAIADGFRGQRLPFCFACGYDLRNHHADRCPECGSSTQDTTAGDVPPTEKLRENDEAPPHSQ
ncbi:MAG TPA: hypothetical protein VGB55_13260, partial [Tepidisphaeraceae bacterium]